MWAFNEACTKDCKESLGRSGEDSLYCKNAVELRNRMLEVAHMVIMTGLGNSEMLALSPSRDVASVKLCRARAHPRVSQHSGESLWTAIETIDGWHAKHRGQSLIVW